MEVRGGRAEARTRKSAVTREKIMEAAAELMVERGGTDFQMIEVSSRCEMSKGSLYYFADKGELVRAVMDRSVEALVDAVERVVADAPSAADSILGLVRALAEALRPGGPLMLAMLGSGTSATGAPAVEGPRLARVLAILTAQLERAKGEGLVREDADSRLCAAAVAGAFLVFEHVAPDGAPESVEALTRRILDLALSGVGTERGRAVFLG